MKNIDYERIVVDVAKNSQASYEDVKEAFSEESLTLSEFISVVLGLRKMSFLGDPVYYRHFVDKNIVYELAVRALLPDDPEKCFKKGKICLIRQEQFQHRLIYWISPLDSLKWVINEYLKGLQVSPFVVQFIFENFKVNPKKRGPDPSHVTQIQRMVELSQEPEHVEKTSAARLWDTVIGEHAWKLIVKESKEETGEELTDKQLAEKKVRITKRIAKDPKFAGKRNKKVSDS
jgi:hypothetical protein